MITNKIELIDSDLPLFTFTIKGDNSLIVINFESLTMKTGDSISDLRTIDGHIHLDTIYGWCLPLSVLVHWFCGINYTSDGGSTAEFQALIDSRYKEWSDASAEKILLGLEV